MIRKQKGFTLIELLVVIAIIGILSSVVLASLNSARAKGSDAAVQSGLSNFQAQAAIFYNIGQDYGTTAITSCTGTGDTGSVFNTSGDAQGASIVTNVTSNASGHVVACTSATSTYTFAAELSTGAYWCVDGSGYTGTTTAAAIGNGLCTATD